VRRQRWRGVCGCAVREGGLVGAQHVGQGGGRPARIPQPHPERAFPVQAAATRTQTVRHRLWQGRDRTEQRWMRGQPPARRCARGAAAGTASARPPASCSPLRVRPHIERRTHTATHRSSCSPAQVRSCALLLCATSAASRKLREAAAYVPPRQSPRPRCECV
jgi:hypothetical protein